MKIPPKNIMLALLLSLLAVPALYSQSFPQSSWEVLPDLPYEQKNHVTTGWKYGDTLFIITAGGRINNSRTDKVLMYNTVSQAYRELAPIPEEVENAGGFVIGDSLYIVGGSQGILGLLSKKVYRLNLKSNTWVRKNDFPFTIGEISASAVAYKNQYAYVVAGLNGLIALNSVYLYNAQTDTWTSATPLPIIGIFGTAVGMLNDSTMFVAGGIRLGNLFSNTYLGRINPGNLLSITWSAGPLFPAGGIYDLGAWGNRNGRMFFTGGSTLLGDSKVFLTSDKTYMYSEESNTYDTLEDKPTPITHTQIYGYDSYNGGITHNEIYAPGGSAGFQAVNAHEKLIVDDSVRQVTNISVSGSEIPGGYSLYQNYPNPFNPSTVIRFDVPDNGAVTLKLYDFLGREIRVLLSSAMSAGSYEYTLDASGLAGGVYFYTLSAGSYKETKKMVLMK
jgi:hypothetical protein